MAVVSGFDGLVAITGVHGTVDVALNQWTMDLVQEAFQYRVFGNKAGALAAKGGYAIRGSCSGFIDDSMVLVETTDLLSDSTLSTFVLSARVAATAVTYSFSAHVHNLRFGVDVNQAPTTFSFDFTGSGDVTVAP